MVSRESIVPMESIERSIFFYSRAKGHVGR